MYNITPVKNRQIFYDKQQFTAKAFSVHYITTPTDGMHTSTESTMDIYRAVKGNFRYGLLMHSVKCLLQ
jgi:hypothetical protein